MLRSLALLGFMTTPVMAQESSYTFTGITNIDVRNGVTVNVVPGENVTVTATAVAGDVDQLQIRKFGPWLAINRNTRWFIFPYGRADEIVVTVTLPELKAIKAFDDAVATATGFSGETLRAEALQGGTVVVSEVEITDLTLYATEGGDMTVMGACDTAEMEAVINAVIVAGELACAQVAATTRSGGSISANAATLASMDDSAGGTIDITGSPTFVEYLRGFEPEAETEGDG